MFRVAKGWLQRTDMVRIGCIGKNLLCPAGFLGTRRTLKIRHFANQGHFLFGSKFRKL